MGITLTALADGTVMDASVVTARFTTIQTWQNGNIATGDITNASIPTRAFRRAEHYLSVQPRSRAVTGGCTRETTSPDPLSRSYANVDSHGNTVWADISTMASKFYAEDAGTVEVVYEWWSWATQSDQVNPEALNTADFRLVIAGTAVADSEVTLFDAGTDAGATDGGVFNYPARNFEAIAQRSVTPGWVTVKLQVRIATQGAAGANRGRYALVMVGARNKHVEYWRM